MNHPPNSRAAFSPLVLTLLCCCAAMMLSSCSKKTANPIFGKWQVQGDSMIIEFKPDGTMVNYVGGLNITNKCTFSDDTHFKIEMPEILPMETKPVRIHTVDCMVKINGDELDMENTPNVPGQAQAHAQTVRMKRIK
jgi:hypothetical protein